jgi:Pyruvate/2-oxoacid:ferredoxin oxidoreductase delta subunit
MVTVDEGALIDFRFCKGCGVCANECPFKAIAMKREV